MIDWRDDASDERYRHRWYGKYRAFVRDADDPERLGRLRLEVPAVLGVGRANWSAWAAPCFPYGGNDDTGMFLVPEEGASVWAEFQGGHPQYPIWSGVWLAGSNPGEQPEESKRVCEKAHCLDCTDAKDHAEGADAREHVKFHGHPPYACPRVKVLMKTETGHTILADDRDGSECLKIIDRAGQSIHLAGRVKPELQIGNVLKRGTRTAEAGDGLDVALHAVDGRARIELTDMSRQFIRMEAWHDHEKIHIQSCDASRSRWQKIVLDTTKGREQVRILGLGGAQEITIDSAAGREKVLIRDKAGQVMEMQAAAGIVRLKAAGLLLLNS